MTWQTVEGDRHLVGAESALVGQVIRLMAERIFQDVQRDQDRPQFVYGVELFDALSPPQQLALIKTLAEHLLLETDTTLELTSLNESAVYAIYRALVDEIEREIDEDASVRLSEAEYPTDFWRSACLDAYNELFPNEQRNEVYAGDDRDSPWVCPRDSSSVNYFQWESLADMLADRVLCDRDFEMAELFLDTAPDRAAELKAMLGISDDYYSDAGLDSPQERWQASINTVRDLTRKKPK